MHHSYIHKSRHSLSLSLSGVRAPVFKQLLLTEQRSHFCIHAVTSGGSGQIELTSGTWFVRKGLPGATGN